LIKHLETESCKDQLFLLMYEPQTADILYCILIEKSISMIAKKKVLKVRILILLKLIKLNYKVVHFIVVVSITKNKICLWTAEVKFALT